MTNAQAKVIIDAIVGKYGMGGLAMYLQGSCGQCPFCGVATPPHGDNCAFANEAKKLLSKGA